MSEFLQFLANGIILGSIIALTAIGLSLVYGILNLPNFAHGDYLTLGAYLAFFFSASMGLHLLPAAFAAMILAAIFGVALDRIVWRPMRKKKAGLVTLLITSMGVAFALRYTIQILWGSRIKTYGVPIQEGISIFGAKVTPVQILIVIFAFTLVFLVHYLLQYTKTGKAMRALADNLDLARISGIDVDRVIIITWILSSALAAAGGIMLGLDTHLRPVMGWNLLIVIFAAVILGGVGNPY
ncbi:MAG: branched-chain amino acid ABC transporter permease, partial [Candidatus Hydrothermarchaeota archaeon]|nr:branched-chain amino acid ABC transporter permease [Candidatus Hydrothermarchaeota archaeon]